jgi:hypothetical protein
LRGETYVARNFVHTNGIHVEIGVCAVETRLASDLGKGLAMGKSRQETYKVNKAAKAKVTVENCMVA